MSIYANRGQALEGSVKLTATVYRKRGLAYVERVGQQAVHKRGGELKRRRSTVDFLGVAAGMAVAFDCKETKISRLPRDHVPQHQRDVLEDTERAGGVAFLLVEFTRAPGYPIYAAAWSWCADYLKRADRASWPLQAFQDAVDKGEPVVQVHRGKYGVPVPFLEAAISLNQRLVDRAMLNAKAGG